MASGLADENIRIQFAVLLDHDDPISGSVVCTIGKVCRLLEQEEHPELGLTVNLHRERDYLAGKLNVRCKDSCSFSNGRSTTEFQDVRQFDFFNGEDGIRIPLVLKPREKIGRVLLLYP
ncbi:hypothetical protein J2857_003356 [Neorhizobium galegae]|nr:hypothetical protein [Neorhizobium galegae]